MMQGVYRILVAEGIVAEAEAFAISVAGAAAVSAQPGFSQPVFRKNHSLSGLGMRWIMNSNLLCSYS